MPDFFVVGKKDDLKPGEAKIVNVNGNEVALYNVDGEFYATSNTCLHRGGPLGDGFLEGNVITCPWHGWQYDVKTGACSMNPQMKVNCYEVKVEGNEIKIALNKT